MLLLVTVGLVLAGLILLIIGFVQDSLTLIYLSIACAAVAGVALIVFSRLSRRQAVTTMAGEAIPAAAAPPSPGLVTAGVVPPAHSGRSTMGAPAAQQPPTVSRSGAGPRAPEPQEREPIVARTAADPVEERFDSGEPTPPQPLRPVAREASPATSRLEPVQAPMAARAAGDLSEDEWADDDWGDEVVFPIEDYDELRVGEIVPLLPELDPEELEEVRDREVATKNRASIVARIDELLGTGQPTAPAAKAAPARTQARKAPAAKASPSKASASRAQAPTSKTPAKQAAAPAKAAPSKSTASKTAEPKAAAAGKSAPSKATPSRTAADSGKVAAKKAPAKAAPAPAPAKKTAAKEAPAKSAATKKAVPAKKAAASKSAPPATRKRT